jgi:hypothetical protein
VPRHYEAIGSDVGFPVTVRHHLRGGEGGPGVYGPLQPFGEFPMLRPQDETAGGGAVQVRAGSGRAAGRRLGADGPDRQDGKDGEGEREKVGDRDSSPHRKLRTGVAT